MYVNGKGALGVECLCETETVWDCASGKLQCNISFAQFEALNQLIVPVLMKANLSWRESSQSETDWTAAPTQDSTMWAAVTAENQSKSLSFPTEFRHITQYNRYFIEDYIQAFFFVAMLLDKMSQYKQFSP